ncbi:hypothetical protein [Campylobacter sp. MG1]|uniref:hypothetical protein n=1 Tax=Campylobacter sp. MG1 TaxID=2976332 RepID=UPI00226C9FA4|nr:hypothetical protein [Campylobacter sp. MG1]
MYKLFRKIKSILFSIFVAIVFTTIVIVVLTEVFKINLNSWWALVVVILPVIFFVGSYSNEKADSECENCKEVFMKRKIKTNILSKEKIQEDVKRDGIYIRQAFWVGEKEEIYECENCGNITSKIIEYKEKI